VFEPRSIGDFNSDGIVDAADYTVYRDNLWTTGPTNPADANGDGVVTTTDYAVWKAYYGTTTAGAALTIPEPSALVIAGVVSLVFATRRRSCLV
jgi:hypothetical protein